MTAELTGSARELVLSRIRDVADFPEPGILFKDISPLLGDPAAFGAVVDAFTSFGGADGVGPVDKVAGIEARGFILAAPVALDLGVGFVPVRKMGKLPGVTLAATYSLEYGEASIEVVHDAFAPGERVLLVDDVLATGGTVEAAIDLVRRAGAEVAGVAVLLELSFLAGRARLTAAGDDVHALITV